MGGVSGVVESFAQNKYTGPMEFFPQNFQNLTDIPPQGLKSAGL